MIRGNHWLINRSTIEHQRIKKELSIYQFFRCPDQVSFPVLSQATVSINFFNFQLWNYIISAGT